MIDEKRQQSLRCLFASVASISVMEWFLKNGTLAKMATEADDIDDVLINVRTFFLSGTGLNRQEVRDQFVPVDSPLQRYIYGVLFSDAVRWWASAHRTRQDENKYLRASMYKEEFVTIWNHFYHEFRNNQLAHFPGGTKSNDDPFLTPVPYGFTISDREHKNFRSMLAHSIKLTLLGAKEWEIHMDSINAIVDENVDMPAKVKEALNIAVRKTICELDDEIMKVPTRNYFPEADDN